jgi:arginase
VADEQVVQIGEREARNPDYAWPDVALSAMTRIDVFTARDLGPQGVLALATPVLERVAWPFWIHLDVDVLDQAVMPAVDSPGSPGIDSDELRGILRPLLCGQRCIGMTVAIFDPDLDPDGAYARLIVNLLRDVSR